MSNAKLQAAIADLYRQNPDAKYITTARIKDAYPSTWEEQQAAYDELIASGVLVEMTAPSNSGKSRQRVVAHHINRARWEARGGIVTERA